MKIEDFTKPELASLVLQLMLGTTQAQVRAREEVEQDLVGASQLKSDKINLVLTEMLSEIVETARSGQQDDSIRDVNGLSFADVARLTSGIGIFALVEFLFSLNLIELIKEKLDTDKSIDTEEKLRASIEGDMAKIKVVISEAIEHATKGAFEEIIDGRQGMLDEIIHIAILSKQNKIDRVRVSAVPDDDYEDDYPEQDEDYEFFNGGSDNGRTIH